MSNDEIKLPEPDTHCYDEDTQADVWSYSAGLVREIIAARPAADAGEVERLTAELKKANAQAEHFEREWYLRGDEIERLRAAPSARALPKPYAYEFGRSNGDGTYSVVIERGDMVQVGERRYESGPPKNAHKDWPVKRLYAEQDLLAASKPAEAASVRDQALEEADELLGIAWDAMLKLGLNGRGSDCSLSHEVRMFAAEFSSEGRDGPGALQIRGTGRFMQWRKTIRALGKPEAAKGGAA